jgi:hypothetical protein
VVGEDDGLIKAGGMCTLTTGVQRDVKYLKGTEVGALLGAALPCVQYVRRAKGSARTCVHKDALGEIRVAGAFQSTPRFCSL